MNNRAAVCTLGNTTLKGREVSALEIYLEENLISTGKVRCPETENRPSFEIGIPLSYDFVNVFTPWWKYIRTQDPVAAIKWNAKDAIDRLYSNLPKADKITGQMCADGLATLQKIFPTYHDLCTKYYNIAEEAKRAGGKGVKTRLR
ncbi:hypothetical protein FOZ60_007803 [Perkinsus olseni]|uniref:Uncharacterized protein n=1 Tax=Perkinsus olseni TaxID=32597 RepID=A0A7J6PEE3_PEROL|nr:hypothetical protein FOZ60_007803 [Perkinsus olseni]